MTASIALAKSVGRLAKAALRNPAVQQGLKTGARKGMRYAQKRIQNRKPGKRQRVRMVSSSLPAAFDASTSVTPQASDILRGTDQAMSIVKGQCFGKSGTNDYTSLVPQNTRLFTKLVTAVAPWQFFAWSYIKIIYTANAGTDSDGTITFAVATTKDAADEVDANGAASSGMLSKTFNIRKNDTFVIPASAMAQTVKQFQLTTQDNIDLTKPANMPAFLCQYQSGISGSDGDKLGIIQIVYEVRVFKTQTVIPKTPEMLLRYNTGSLHTNWLDGAVAKWTAAPTVRPSNDFTITTSSAGVTQIHAIRPMTVRVMISGYAGTGAGSPTITAAHTAGGGASLASSYENSTYSCNYQEYYRMTEGTVLQYTAGGTAYTGLISVVEIPSTYVSSHLGAFLTA